jgi:aminoglycoside 3-N-acetyltransferase I
MIRTLGPGDVELLEGMSAMFGEAFGEPHTYRGAPPARADLGQLLGSPSFIAIAALEGDAVIGGLAAYVLPKFEQERSEIYIYDLAVAEPHRRKGTATALIRQLQALAAERGAWVIYVQADHGDDPAIALYSGLGTREDVLHFDIPVPAAGGGDERA